MAVQAKPFWQSSTVWINVAGVVVLLLDFIVRSGSVKDADVIAILIAVVNIVRRFQAPKVVQPLSFK